MSVDSRWTFRSPRPQGSRGKPGIAQRALRLGGPGIGTNVPDWVRASSLDGTQRAPVDLGGQKAAHRKGAVAVQNARADKNAEKQADGLYVGANGTTYPRGTPLASIPGFMPSDGSDPKETILHVNGIMTTASSQAEALQAVADKTGARVIGIHNATEGAVVDLKQCVHDKLQLGKNPAVDTLADTIYAELKAGRPVHLMAHSQGGIITSRALSRVRKRLQDEGGLSKANAAARMSQIKCETFGAAAGHYPSGPKYVHYVNRFDPVPLAVGLGAGLIPVGQRTRRKIAGILRPIGRPFREFARNNPGKGAVVHHFTRWTGDVVGNHSFVDLYLDRRLDFEHARSLSRSKRP